MHREIFGLDLGNKPWAAMRGGASDDGMLARFDLLVLPETGVAWKTVDCYLDGPAKDAAFQVFEELDAPFTEWRSGFEAELRTGEMYPALESHLAKYRKLVPALAS